MAYQPLYNSQSLSSLITSLPRPQIEAARKRKQDKELALRQMQMQRQLERLRLAHDAEQKKLQRAQSSNQFDKSLALDREKFGETKSKNLLDSFQAQQTISDNRKYKEGLLEHSANSLLATTNYQKDMLTDSGKNRTELIRYHKAMEGIADRSDSTTRRQQNINYYLGNKGLGITEAQNKAGNLISVRSQNVSLFNADKANKTSNRSLDITEDQNKAANTISLLNTGLTAQRDKNQNIISLLNATTSARHAATGEGTLALNEKNSERNYIEAVKNAANTHEIAKGNLDARVLDIAARTQESGENRKSREKIAAASQAQAAINTKTKMVTNFITLLKNSDTHASKMVAVRALQNAMGTMTPDMRTMVTMALGDTWNKTNKQIREIQWVEDKGPDPINPVQKEGFSALSLLDRAGEQLGYKYRMHNKKNFVENSKEPFNPRLMMRDDDGETIIAEREPDSRITFTKESQLKHLDFIKKHDLQIKKIVSNGGYFPVSTHKIWQDGKLMEVTKEVSVFDDKPRINSVEIPQERKAKASPHVPGISASAKKFRIALLTNDEENPEFKQIKNRLDKDIFFSNEGGFGFDTKNPRNALMKEIGALYPQYQIALRGSQDDVFNWLDADEIDPNKKVDLIMVPKGYTTVLRDDVTGFGDLASITQTAQGVQTFWSMYTGQPYFSKTNFLKAMNPKLKTKKALTDTQITTLYNTGAF